MAKAKRKDTDQAATLDQAAAAVEAGDKGQARTLLKVYRRWRLAGNVASPQCDERYGELADPSGPKIVRSYAEHDVSARPFIRPYYLLLAVAEGVREKYAGIEVDPVAALRGAELALERGDLEAASKHIEDYDGFRVCGGEEPPGGKEKHDILWKRLSALKREPR
jgi:hypothetical protein